MAFVYIVCVLSVLSYFLFLYPWDNDNVTIKIGHLINVSNRIDTGYSVVSQVNYYAQEILIHRPDSGKGVQAFICNSCGNKLQLETFSRKLARRYFIIYNFVIVLAFSLIYLAYMYGYHWGGL